MLIVKDKHSVTSFTASPDVAGVTLFVYIPQGIAARHHADQYASTHDKGTHAMSARTKI